MKSSRSQSVHRPGGGPPALVTRMSTSPAAASTLARPASDVISAATGVTLDAEFVADRLGRGLQRLLRRARSSPDRPPPRPARAAQPSPSPLDDAQTSARLPVSPDPCQCPPCRLSVRSRLASARANRKAANSEPRRDPVLLLPQSCHNFHDCPEIGNKAPWLSGDVANFVDRPARAVQGLIIMTVGVSRGSLGEDHRKAQPPSVNGGLPIMTFQTVQRRAKAQGLRVYPGRAFHRHQRRQSGRSGLRHFRDDARRHLPAVTRGAHAGGWRCRRPAGWRIWSWPKGRSWARSAVWCISTAAPPSWPPTAPSSRRWCWSNWSAAPTLIGATYLLPLADLLPKTDYALVAVDADTPRDEIRRSGLRLVHPRHPHHHGQRRTAPDRGYRASATVS